MGLQVLILSRTACDTLEDMRSAIKATAMVKRAKDNLGVLVEEVQTYCNHMEDALYRDWTPKKAENSLKEYKNEQRELKVSIKELQLDKEELKLEIEELKLEKREVTFAKNKPKQENHIDRINKTFEKQEGR